MRWVFGKASARAAEFGIQVGRRFGEPVQCCGCGLIRGWARPLAAAQARRRAFQPAPRTRRAQDALTLASHPLTKRRCRA